MIQAFLFDTSDETFGVPVLLWNIWHGVNQFDTSTIQNHLDLSLRIQVRI
jgi:hypothetical protein